MIRYLKGQLLKIDEDRIVVLTGGVGYEILLPDIVRGTYHDKKEGEDMVELFISFQQTAQQPKPVLIGFNSEIEREFFERLIQVKSIGPVMAARSMTMPVSLIARAIEERDVAMLRKLKGVGARKAEMIISELNGKVGKYALMREGQRPAADKIEDFRKQVEEVLVKQLGHSRAEAAAMVTEAVKRNPAAATPEDLFEEVYRGQKEHSRSHTPV
ncbi:MAG: helix-hairpin-helix domain-containing protein [Proteobacteria bacterium]|nr:helix-hairpin-helix domain-containing protein [Pseudomonadota bacterium]